IASSSRTTRWVARETARTLSISSPHHSTRTGERRVLGNTSTMPPRTANSPGREILSPHPAHGRVEDVTVRGAAGRQVDDEAIREHLGLAGVPFGRRLARGDQEGGTPGVRGQVGSDPARGP